MSETQKFQEIVRGIREDLTFLADLYRELDWKITMNPNLNSDFYYYETALGIREWVLDVFLDKIYDVDSKILNFLTDLSLDAKEIHKKFSVKEIEKYAREIIYEKDGIGQGKTYENLKYLKSAIAKYRHALDAMFDSIRKAMYTKNWEPMKKISLENYVLTGRRKYIKARECLERAKQAIKNGKDEDVFTNLRSAIELSVKERFGFTKIKSFYRFLKFADENGLYLPSIRMLYFYYNEGSSRLHAGRLHTPLEYQSSLIFVDNFIDRLELVKITKEEIDNFKKKCDCVE